MKIEEKPLLKLVDGDILTFTEDHDQSDGCETCDWGSSYVQNFNIVTTHGTLRMDTDQMYDYLISHDFLMKLLLPNAGDIQKMTIAEFVAWFKSAVNSHLAEDGYSSSLRNSKVTFTWVPA